MFDLLLPDLDFLRSLGTWLLPIAALVQLAQHETGEPNLETVDLED